jgi:hypothetical protein
VMASEYCFILLSFSCPPFWSNLFWALFLGDSSGFSEQRVKAQLSDQASF